MTPDQLSELLRRVNVAAVAADSKVSVKTIYRLRHKVNAPNWATITRLLDSIKRVQPEALEEERREKAGAAA